jgi:hypothetical protein
VRFTALNGGAVFSFSEAISFGAGTPAVARFLVALDVEPEV